MFSGLKTFLEASFATAPPEMIVPGTYSMPLVALSLLVAIVCACSALHIATGIEPESPRWIRMVAGACGSLVLGVGIWAMHFIGMLSFRLCATVAYDPLVTVGSMLPSLTSSMVALELLTRDRVRRREIVVGGLLMGSGIGAMHYSGMAAMRMAPSLRYDPVTFAASVVVAITLAILALWVRYGLATLQRRLSEPARTLVAGTILGLAVAAMHYTGMAAARFVGFAEVSSSSTAALSDSGFLSITISAASVLLAIVVLGVTMLLRYRVLLDRVRAGEARLRAVGQVAIDGIVIVDANTVVREFNPAAERIFGYRADEVIGQPAAMLMPTACAIMHGSPDTPCDHPIQQIDGGVVLEVDSRRRDGTLFPSRLAIGQTQLQDQGLCVIFVSDITEKKRTEDALKDSELKLRTLVSNLPGISYRLATIGEHGIEFISAGVSAVTGYAPEEFVGRDGVLRWRSITHRDDRERADRLRIEAMEAARQFQFEYRIRHKSGNWRWVWESASAINGPDGKPAWVDGVIFDITERREMEEALREAKAAAERATAAKSSFVANMSHEIRTPLNAVLGFAQVGLKRTRGEAEEVTFRRILESGELLLGIVNDVLDFSKIEAGKVEIEALPFDPCDVVDRGATLIAPQAIAKGLAFAVFEAPDLPALCVGDRLRLSQVVVNLLSNATKFTRKGEIRLEVAHRDGMLRLEVSDTGIGMTPQQVDRLFNAFEQGDGSITRRFGGTGLGLVISKRLVEAMNGAIVVESRVGEGTRFRIEIPMPAHVGPRSWPRRSVVLVGLPTREADAVAECLRRRGSEARILPEGVELGGEGELLIVSADALRRMPRGRAEALLARGPQLLVAIPPGGEESIEHWIRLGCRPIPRPLRARHVLESHAGSGGAAKPVRGAGRRPLAGLRILAVEDNEINRLVLTEFLEIDGAEVVLAEDGVEALERLNADGSDAFDIVLTDIQMPVMDGFETTRRIIALDPGLPVVGVTAHSLTQELSRCLEVGMADCITKPVDARHLTEVVHSRARRSSSLVTGRTPTPTPVPVDSPAAERVDPVDWSAFERTFATREGLRRRLPTLLVDSLAGAPDRLSVAVDAVDHVAIAREAHKAKGTMAQLGFRDLADAASHCELAAKSQDADCLSIARDLATLLGEVRLSAERYVAAQARAEPETR